LLDKGKCKKGFTSWFDCNEFNDCEECEHYEKQKDDDERMKQVEIK